jgi:Icc-related predicted phosphoesterase
MKIAFCSDLHLEINNNLPAKMEKIEPVDYLLLAGDITCLRFFQEHRTDSEARSMKKRFNTFLQETCADVGRILWIPGNHEYYGHHFIDVDEYMWPVFKGIDPRIKYHNQILEVSGDVCFIGATLWTNFDNGNPLVEMIVQEGMNDYHVIKYTKEQILPGGNILRGHHTLTKHYSDFSFIKKQYEEANYNNKKTIVFTHHSPSMMSHSNHRFGDTDLKFGYHSNYGQWLEDSNVHTWIHGHTHHNVDYDHRGTRVVSAMHGYEHYDFRPIKGHKFSVGYLEV